MRTGIHKGNPLVPPSKQLGVPARHERKRIYFFEKGKTGAPCGTPRFSHCTRQPEADRKRPVDAPHRACIKAAHFFLKSLFVNGAHLLKQHY